MLERSDLEVIERYFPGLSVWQKEQLGRLGALYREWNDKINVISRKDIDSLYIHHVLHSLAIARVVSFREGTRILDVGTGGGFPGIPLAIMFPEASFHLVDSIGKKIKVVEGVASELGLTNVKAEQSRVETFSGQYDFIVSRAVTAFPDFMALVKGKVREGASHSLPNGLLYLKGGDFEEEIKKFRSRIMLYDLTDFFEEDFFETKKLIYYRF